MLSGCGILRNPVCVVLAAEARESTLQKTEVGNAASVCGDNGRFLLQPKSLCAAPPRRKPELLPRSALFSDKFRQRALQFIGMQFGSEHRLLKQGRPRARGIRQTHNV